jgi:hypothetical protein
MPLDLIAAQARAVLDDIGADAIKTGMLGDRGVVETVAVILDAAKTGAFRRSSIRSWSPRAGTVCWPTTPSGRSRA